MTAFGYVEDQRPSLELDNVTPYYVEEPQQSKPYGDWPNDHNYEKSDHMVSLNAHTLMLMWLMELLVSLGDITIMQDHIPILTT